MNVIFLGLTPDFLPMPVTRQASFWMMNTPLPLSAAYIDPEGIIQEIHDLQPYNTNSVLSQSDNIRFVPRLLRAGSNVIKSLQEQPCGPKKAA